VNPQAPQAPQPADALTGQRPDPAPSPPCDDSPLTAWEAAVLADEGARFTIEELRALAMGL
jgi:hypothetical protein